MELQPTLRNDLVVLRPLHITDFDGLYKVAKDPLIWEQHPAKERYKKDQFEKIFRAFLESHATLVVLNQSTNSIIGASRYKLVPKDALAVEIGWSFLARQYWGGLYNKSVKHLMIEHAFQTMERIVFYIDQSNIRSQKAVEKVGARIIEYNDFPNLVRMEKGYLTYLIEKSFWSLS